MWTKQCLALTRRGKRCRRRSTLATWCFGFQDEKYDSATWVETCGHHVTEAHGQVAQQDIRHFTKGFKA